MPTARATPHGKTTSRRAASAAQGKRTARKTTAARAQKAVTLLKADHRNVEKLFGQFEKAGGEERKRQLAQQICQELRLHMQIEEEIFYPTSRDFLDDEEIVNEAVVEHQAAKDLIEQIEGLSPSDELYDAKLTVLQEQIEHHVQEEEETFFPKVQKSGMDLDAIGDRLAARKAQLQAGTGRMTH